jgi:hypothetical protein
MKFAFYPEDGGSRLLRNVKILKDVILLFLSLSLVTSKTSRSVYLSPVRDTDN